ncbi:MAG: DUF3307 domain-containing protein [Armatimonadetes bacterium]|nr:DUF3307 domain-containing protein [Akkermansiaceae bacterium]
MLSEFATEQVVRGGVAGAGLLLLAMMIGHALGDYPLQGHFLATVKNRHADISGFFGGGPGPKGMWIHALTAHALVQAGIVWLITGSAVLVIAELVLHWVIDYVRCEEWISFTLDQALHVGCKMIYAVALVAGLL